MSLFNLFPIQPVQYQTELSYEEVRERLKAALTQPLLFTDAIFSRFYSQNKKLVNGKLKDSHIELFVLSGSTLGLFAQLLPKESGVQIIGEFRTPIYVQIFYYGLLFLDILYAVQHVNWQHLNEVTNLWVFHPIASFALIVCLVAKDKNDQKTLSRFLAHTIDAELITEI